MGTMTLKQRDHKVLLLNALSLWSSVMATLAYQDLSSLQILIEKKLLTSQLLGSHIFFQIGPVCWQQEEAWLLSEMTYLFLLMAETLWL